MALAHSSYSVCPSLSRFYLAQLSSLSTEAGIPLADRVARRFCSRCSSLFVPGINCTVRVAPVRNPRVKRKRDERDEGRKGNGNRIARKGVDSTGDKDQGDGGLGETKMDQRPDGDGGKVSDTTDPSRKRKRRRTKRELSNPVNGGDLVVVAPRPSVVVNRLSQAEPPLPTRSQPASKPSSGDALINMVKYTCTTCAAVTLTPGLTKGHRQLHNASSSRSTAPRLVSTPSNTPNAKSRSVTPSTPSSPVPSKIAHSDTPSTPSASALKKKKQKDRRKSGLQSLIAKKKEGGDATGGGLNLTDFLSTL
ncbi:hypothetical protein HK104_001633 [Borealophlyctis nickersoniae]|nr:hypothetical protein HK104_001633 [Borealophlyctis nickersoniae]